MFNNLYALIATGVLTVGSATLGGTMVLDTTDKAMRQTEAIAKGYEYQLQQAQAILNPIAPGQYIDYEEKRRQEEIIVGRATEEVQAITQSEGNDIPQ